jgi:hypothetical protein
MDDPTSRLMVEDRDRPVKKDIPVRIFFLKHSGQDL